MIRRFARLRTDLNRLPLSEGRAWIESLGDRDEIHLLVCVEKEPVGSVQLFSLNDVYGTAEIGYEITPEYWGNGYATDAVEALCKYAFEERRLHKVYGTVFATNPGSHRVMEKVGFKKEGVMRKEAFTDGEYVDVHRFGLLSEDWHQR